MKLYTEEDIRKAWNTAYTDALSIDEPEYKPKFYEDFIQSVTPIVLPTDEEIEDKGKWVFNDAGHTIYTHYNTVPSWVAGAKWMRDKIQGGNQ